MKVENKKGPAKFKGFVSGVCDITDPGEDTPRLHLPFENERLSVTRFFAALSTDTKISKVISVPYDKKIKAQSKVTISGEEYIAIMVQPNEHSLPASTTITLAEV